MKIDPRLCSTIPRFCLSRRAASDGLHALLDHECCICGANTNKQYARKNGGRCKPCVTGVPHESEAERRIRTIIDHGWDAYAREEGHYDIPDNH